MFGGGPLNPFCPKGFSIPLTPPPPTKIKSRIRHSSTSMTNDTWNLQVRWERRVFVAKQESRNEASRKPQECVCIVRAKWKCPLSSQDLHYRGSLLVGITRLAVTQVHCQPASTHAPAPACSPQPQCQQELLTCLFTSGLHSTLHSTSS